MTIAMAITYLSSLEFKLITWLAIILICSIVSLRMDQVPDHYTETF